MEERIGLRLDGDASTLTSAFKQAQSSVDALGKTFEKSTDAFDDMFKRMETRSKSIGGMLERSAVQWDMAAKKADDFGKRATQSVKNVIEGLGKLNQATEMVGKAWQAAQGMMNIAKLSAEFQAMEKAVPVEKMEQLRLETDGTVSEMELLKRAVTEMGLETTVAADRGVRELKRFEAQVKDLETSIKVGLGKALITVVNAFGIDKSLEQQARENVERRGGGIPLLPFSGTNLSSVGPGHAEYEAELARLQGRERESEIRSMVMQGHRTLFDQSGALKTARERAEYDAAQAMINRGNAVSRGAGYAAQAEAAARRGGGGGAGADTSWTWGRAFGAGSSNWAGDAVRSAWQTGSGAVAGWASDSRVAEQQQFGADFVSGFGGGAAAGTDGAAKRVAELEAMLQDRSGALGGAFGALTDGIAASVDAAITGSEAIGKAFMKASAAAMRSLALESAVRAAYHTAAAIGTAVTGNAPAAAGHIAAAGKYAAVAAFAGVSSMALSAGAGGGGGASAGGPSTAPGGGFVSNRSVGGGNGGTVEHHYHIHGTISAASHRELGGVLVRTQRKALKSGTASAEAERTVHFQ